MDDDEDDDESHTCAPPPDSSSSFPTLAFLHLLRFSSDNSSSCCCGDRSPPTSNKLSSILHPSPMKKPSPPPSRRSAPEAERVVQTDVATFREVVHRLTGASPTQSASSDRLHQDSRSKKMLGDGRNRNRAHLSILQRRKSSNKLHHLLLTAASSAQPPILHSPVTPLSLPSPLTPISSDEEKLGSRSSAMGKPKSGEESMKEGSEEKGFFFCQLRGGRPISRPKLLRLFPESPTVEAAATQWEEEEEEEEKEQH